MVNLYCNLIIKHRKDIDDVPIKIRQEVIDELYRRGYDEHGDPLPVNEPTTDGYDEVIDENAEMV